MTPPYPAVLERCGHFYVTNPYNPAAVTRAIAGSRQDARRKRNAQLRVIAVPATLFLGLAAWIAVTSRGDGQPVSLTLFAVLSLLATWRAVTSSAETDPELLEYPGAVHYLRDADTVTALRDTSAHPAGGDLHQAVWAATIAHERVRGLHRALVNPVLARTDEPEVRRALRKDWEQATVLARLEDAHVADLRTAPAPAAEERLAA